MDGGGYNSGCYKSVYIPARRLDRIPAIALTAYARSEDARRALKAGYQTRVARPIEPIESATVAASLGGRGGSEESHEDGAEEAMRRGND